MTISLIDSVSFFSHQKFCVFLCDCDNDLGALLCVLGDLETDPVDLVTWRRLEADPGEVTQHRRDVSLTLDTD